MTSTSPAEPRPPTIRRPPELPRPSHDRSSSNLFPPLDGRPSNLQRQNTDAGANRPAKRRKLHGDTPEDQASNASRESPASRNGTSYSDPKSRRLRLIQPSALRWESSALQNETEEDATVDDHVPDLPARPWNALQHSKSADEPKATHRSRVKIPVPTTPDSMQVPTSVPHFFPKRPAGFFPWTGKHQEDVLNDTNVKQGYFDKPPNPTEKELNTARVPLYNAFKHKSGVDSLSVLFSLVLDQKNQHGLISSASTFRPPPRVTLTEAKRKSWIADLANADVPLRRLSRTIPQGIRGQSLLDQCLQSCVPLNRAIWFAKCVCANEIRTLKRKGTTPAMALGTEGKWLREWTVNVEQFLESRLGRVNIPNWRPNVQYAIRLTTRLYLENLLDRDLYLDWILRSFASAPLDQIPFWLMMVHIYKQDMSCYRRRGRKLAEVLIDKYQQLGKSPLPTVDMLRQRLHHAFRSLLLSRPMNFLMPEKWPDVLPDVRSCLNTSNQQERNILDGLNRINTRTMGSSLEDFSAPCAPDQAIVDILDALRAPYNLDGLAKGLNAACADTTVLVSTCLEWACTRFRYSNARLHLFARLTKRWQRAGHDTDTIILSFLSACREGKVTVDARCLKHLIAQLSRSNSFPVGRYLQWLMVRGLPQKGSIEMDPDTMVKQLGDEKVSHAGQFLLDLPLENIEDHVVNLRNSMLQRSGFDVKLEEDVFRQCIQFIEQELSALSSGSRLQRSTQREPAFASLPWTVRSRVSVWLRSKVGQGAAQTMPGMHVGTRFLGSNLLNCDQFSLVRHILECMEDDAVLADVVGILCCAQDDDLIASLVATVHFHAETFSALGALEALQKRVCQIYMSWRSTKPAMPLLSTMLLDLCTVFPVRTPSVKLLQQDLVRGDRGRAIAACSPYSDGIAESLQQAGATFVEDFEAILQSEPNMTEPTMSGLFAVLVDRIEKQQKFDDDSQTVFSFCHLLSRLRLCRRGQGDILIQNWLSRLAPLLDENFGSLLLRNLIGTGCLTFRAFFDTMTLSRLGLRKIPAVTTMLRHILTPTRDSLSDTVTYQTRTWWFEYSRHEPRAALEVLCEAGLETVHTSSAARPLYFLVNDAALVSSSLSSKAAKWLVQELNSVLGCCSEPLNGTDLRILLGSTNIYSHRFVQVRLWAAIAGAETSEALDPDELVEILSGTLDQTLDQPGGNIGGKARFAQLLEAVGPDVANRLRHQVEAEFLEALPKFPPTKSTSPLSAVFPSDLDHLSLIVEKSFRVCTKHTHPAPGFTSQLIDKLAQCLKSLGSTTSPPIPTSAPGLSGNAVNMSPAHMATVTSSPIASTSESVAGAPVGVVWSYLDYMLQMVCLQRPALISLGRTGPNVKQAQSEQVQLLVRLGMVFSHPAVASAPTFLGNEHEQQKVKEVHDFIVDVIATIVDEVGEEVKMMSAKLLKDKIQEGRLKYLFGSINTTGSAQVHDAGSGLQTVKEGKGVLGDWRPRVWEVLDNGSGKENETSLGLGLFGARRT